METITVRAFRTEDTAKMTEIWNEVVQAGNAFPQEECLNAEQGAEFFRAQSACGVAENSQNGEIVGLYILHPNNVGRCGHICNASYAVKSSQRGQRIGEKLVLHSMETGRTLGFRILQFNAVVESNKPARHLYEHLGFLQLGTIPGGFRAPDGSYQNICPYYIEL